MDNYYLIQNWITNVNLGRRDGAILPDSKYFEIRYDQVVQEPENNLRRICHFLGETYRPVMLTYNRLARQVGPGPDSHTEILQPISTSSVGRWQTDMSGFDKKMADHISGKLLLELGYQRTEVDPFTKEEFFRLIFLAGKYKIVNLIRSSLYRTGILTLNRNMRRPPN
jgi:hypothetical protein